MKVLQLTNKSPWPPVEGGPMAMLAVTNSLLDQGFEVKVLAAATHKFNTGVHEVPVGWAQQTNFETHYIDTRVKPLPAFLNLFSKDSYHISRFFSSSFAARLAALMMETPVDLVIMESVFMLPYLKVIRRVRGNIPVVLRAHNIEHRIWRRIAAGEGNPVKKWYLMHLAHKLERAEKRGAQQFDGIIPITGVDAKWFSYVAPMVPCMPLPFGLHVQESIEPAPAPPPLKLYHLGSMDWYPNIEAVQWFLSYVWPECRQICPGVELHLAGRNMSEKLMQTKEPQLFVHGEIADREAFLQQQHILVAPIFSGSGIRIKILEAMAHGKVVITTGVGAEGINYTHGVNILIANDHHEFIAAIQELQQHPDRLQTIGNQARELIRGSYNPEKLSLSLGQFLVERVTGIQG